MAIERQIDFTGGLNTRIPAHKLPENMVQAAKNVDFSHGDIRPDTGIGGEGGGKQFYYEKGDTWVGTDEANAYTILTIDGGSTSTATVPETQLGNPLTISSTGTYQIGMTDTVTATYGSNLLTTASGAHGLVVNDTIQLAGSDVPAPLVAGTTYFIKTRPAVNTMTLAATEGGTEINLTDNGTGTITLTSVTAVIVNDTELNLGSVSSFVEYNDDLYMGRDSFSLTATTVTSGSKEITLTAADIAKVIITDNVVGTGIADGAVIETVDTGTNKITLNKAATASGSGVSLTMNTAPARIMDGILSKIFPIDLRKPDPHSITVTQLGDNNTARAEGHSVKWFTENFPIPFQWGIARFDDASGAEGGISELTPVSLSLANINSDSSHTSVPVLVKYEINKEDANSSFYGKFALYRVGGTSAVIKKVQDIYLTSQTDGSPLSASVAKSTNDIQIQVSGLPSGSEWKAKWYGYGASGSQKKYNSGGISSITITNDGANYTTAPTVTIAAPGGSGKQATAEAVLSGDLVTNIIITEKGSGYTSAPTVTIANAPSGSDHATGTAVVEASAAEGETTLLTTTSAIKLYGADANHRIDLHLLVKFTSDAISPVSGAPYNNDTREYVFASANVVDATVTGDNGLGLHSGCGSFLDFTPPRTLIEIEPIQNPTKVPYNLKYLTEFNNFFMGSVDTRLYISNYAKPNNYAIDGYLDFEGQITGIVSRGGEAVVFTEHALYRVYGNAHNEMRKVQVPTTHGLPVGSHKTISKIKDSIIYCSHTGICYFDGRSVTVLTDELVQNFTKPSATNIENVSGVIDDTYYLLAAAGDGWKVDMRQSPKICNTTNKATNFHYRPMNNRLYSEGGYLGGASEANKFSFETKDFVGGDINSEKAFYTVYTTGQDFSGIINIKCDGQLIDTFTISTAVSEFNRAFYLSTAKVANRASIEFKDCTGKISSIAIKYDVLAELQKKRFNNVTLTYTGTPSVIVKLDGVEKVSSTTLTDPGTGNTGTAILFFPAMSEGHLPHIVATESETSRISGSVFDAEVI